MAEIVCRCIVGAYKCIITCTWMGISCQEHRENGVYELFRHMVSLETEDGLPRRL